MVFIFSTLSLESKIQGKGDLSPWAPGWADFWLFRNFLNPTQRLLTLLGQSRRGLINGCKNSETSIAEPEPPGATTFRVEPEPIYYLAGAGSGCIFLASKKGKPCVVTKQDPKAVYNGKCDPKKTCIKNSLIKKSKWKMLVYGAGAAWSRLFLPGAGAEKIWS